LGCICRGSRFWLGLSFCNGDHRSHLRSHLGIPRTRGSRDERPRSRLVSKGNPVRDPPLSVTPSLFCLNYVWQISHDSPLHSHTNSKDSAETLGVTLRVSPNNLPGLNKACLPCCVGFQVNESTMLLSTRINWLGSEFWSQSLQLEWFPRHHSPVSHPSFYPVWAIHFFQFIKTIIIPSSDFRGTKYNIVHIQRWLC
jgi:hypothetical protein